MCERDKKKEGSYLTAVISMSVIIIVKFEQTCLSLLAKERASVLGVRRERERETVKHKLSQMATMRSN